MDNCNQSKDGCKVIINEVIDHDNISASKRYSFSIIVSVCFLAMLTLFYLPAYAASNNANNEPNNSTTQSPDNLLEYAEQQIETLQKKGIDLPDSAREVFASNDTVDQAGKLLGDAGLSGDYNESYYILDELNSGLSTLSQPPNLATPLSTLEFFQSAIIKERYDLAAHALNMNLFDASTQSQRSNELVKHLDFLLSNQDLYVFEDMPDRADGLIEPPVGSSSSINGIPRRSIKLGYISYLDRKVPIFIERVRVKDAAPVWVFSSQTVGNIDSLYDQYKPPEFAKYLPNWLTLRFFGMAFWEFLLLILFIIITMGFSWLFSKGASSLANRFISDEDDDSRTNSEKSVSDFVNKLTVPLTFTKDTIDLRGALASDSPDNAWALECDIREQMLAYLHSEQKPYLPAERITLKQNL